MKKIRNYIGLLVLILAGGVYAADAFLGIDIFEIVNPDTSAPLIDTSEFKATVQLDGTVDISKITCSDNRDSSCEVVFEGAFNTSTLGTQTIKATATDSNGNKSEKTITLNVIEGLDTTMYVPTGYYDGINGLSGEALKNALNDIITDHDEFTYTDKDLDDMDVWKMLRDADEDPNNSDNVLLFYSGFSWPKECQDTNKDLLPDECFETNPANEEYIEWNREHVWSKSHGDFEEEDGYEFEVSDSYGAWGAHTDGHHLVAEERGMNTLKNNRFFDDCHNVDKYDSNNDGVVNEDDDDYKVRDFGNYTCGEWYFEPRDEVKGDVARMLFYMVIRYEGEDGDYVDLELTNNLYLYEDLATSIKNSKLPYYENLSTLLQWHIDDPVDEWELERNESIYQIQLNRNPFIDMPELVELIWGTPENPIEYESTTAE